MDLASLKYRNKFLDNKNVQEKIYREKILSSLDSNTKTRIFQKEGGFFVM